MFRCLGMLVLLLPALAFGKVFKCEGDDGRITFSHVPCPSGSGVATAVKLTPANSIQAHGVSQTEAAMGDSRVRSAPRELVVVGQGDDLQRNIQFQIDWIHSRANRETDRSKASALRSAAHLLEEAPADQQTLSLARDVVTAVDRGQGSKASDIARQAAARSAEWRQRNEERRATRAAEDDRGTVVDQHGRTYTRVAGGIVDPETGAFSPRVAGGYVNPETGHFIPAK